jgi:hypothetical protein
VVLEISMIMIGWLFLLFQSEYIADCDDRRAFVTGFDG